MGFMGIVAGFAVCAGTVVPLLLVALMFWLFSTLYAITKTADGETLGRKLSSKLKVGVCWYYLGHSQFGSS